MSPETAVVLSAVVPSGIGLLTFFLVRRDGMKDRAAKRDSKVLRAEEGAYGRATESDVSLIKRLNARLDEAERRAEEAERKNVLLARRVYRLEMLMAAAGMDIPAQSEI